MKPQAAVIDTNVVLDLLLFEDPRVRPLADALDAGRLRWLSCPAMLGELQHVLGRPPLDRWAARHPSADSTSSTAGTSSAPGDGLARVSAGVARWAQLVDFGPAPDGEAPRPPLAASCPGLRCRDADDQIFIELALAEQARWLLTRDRALLALARRAAACGLAILTPERWHALQDRPAADRGDEVDSDAGSTAPHMAVASA